MTATTRRFAARREAIIDTASALINAHGVQGLSLAEVAQAIGLGSTSITYYFRRKEDLAAACFDRALDRLARQVALAGAEPDLRRRILRLVSLTFESVGDLEPGAAHPMVRLNDLRATGDPIRAGLVSRYLSIFREARAFFGEGGDEETQLFRIMRTHVLLDTLYVLPAHLEFYAQEEHRRVEGRLVQLLETGLAPGGTAPLALPDGGRSSARRTGGDDATERFMGVAAGLINERGYRGTSVELIASRLNLTKGSFYHHLAAKDDLVLQCFERSLSTLTAVLDTALASPGTRLEALRLALATFLTIQLSRETPLLRSTALLALPIGLRGSVVARSDRIARRVSGLIIDGISEGSLPPVDPLVAGQLLMSVVNAAYELRERAARVPLSRAVSLYGATLLNGVLADG